MPVSSSMPCYSASDILGFGRQLSTPFSIAMVPALAGWQCQKILRLLPQKRVVLALQDGEQRAVLKLFSRAKDYQREIDGWQQLQHAKLPTANIIAHRCILSC